VLYTPGSRQRAQLNVDSHGYIWLFGGSKSNSPMSDIWRYNISLGWVPIISAAAALSTVSCSPLLSIRYHSAWEGGSDSASFGSPVKPAFSDPESLRGVTVSTRYISTPPVSSNSTVKMMMTRMAQGDGYQPAARQWHAGVIDAGNRWWTFGGQCMIGVSPGDNKCRMLKFIHSFIISSIMLSNSSCVYCIWLVIEFGDMWSMYTTICAIGSYRQDIHTNVCTPCPGKQYPYMFCSNLFISQLCGYFLACYILWIGMEP
jgi:hypothetical protein